MPINIDPELINEFVKRQIAEQDTQARMQTPAVPASEKKNGLGLLAKLIYAAGLGADVGTSIYGESTGVTHEVNPLLKPLDGMNPKLKFPLAAGAEVGGIALLSKLIGKKHPKIMKAIVMGTGASHGAAAVRNIGQIRQGQAALAAHPPSASSQPPSPGMVQLEDGSWINPDYFGR